MNHLRNLELPPNMKQSQPIGFSLARITTDQFAILEETEPSKSDVITELSFNVNIENRLIGVSTKFRFEKDEKPILVIQVSLHYEIEKSSWDELITPDAKKLVVPKGYMAHLSMIAVGTTRGVLHAKIENTPYNKWLIPLINVAQIIDKDVEFNLEEKQHEEANN